MCFVISKEGYNEHYFPVHLYLLQYSLGNIKVDFLRSHCQSTQYALMDAA